MSRLDTLDHALHQACGDRIVSLTRARGELTAVIEPEQLRALAALLRDSPELQFEQLMDLCGLDYSAYAGADALLDGEEPRERHPGRFAVVYHLLSQTHNWRLRLRLFARDDEMPVVESVIDIWPSANWLEREVFDLFGVRFNNHPDLRRLLLPPDWEGHPLRKDYPLEFIENAWTERHLPVMTDVEKEQLQQRRAYGLEILSVPQERLMREIFIGGKEVMPKDK